MDANLTVVQQATYSATAYVLIGLVGSSMNFLVLALSIMNRKQQNGYWILIANIAFADAVVLVQAVAFQAPNAQLALRHTSATCATGSFLTYAGAMVSVLSLPQISMNRYAAFYFAERYDIIYCERNCALFVGLMWAFSIGILTPVVKYAMVEEVYTCGFQPTGALSIYFTIVTTAPSTIGYPLLIWSSYKVWVKLREHTNLVVAASSNVVAHARQLLRLLVVVSILPVVLEVPLLIVRVLIVAFAFDVSPWLLRTFMNMFYLNDAVNPFVTIACMKPYSTSVKKGFSWIFGSLGGAQKTPVAKPIAAATAAPIAVNVSQASHRNTLHVRGSGAAAAFGGLPGTANQLETTESKHSGHAEHVSPLYDRQY